MGASYNILPHVIYVIWQMYKQRTFVNIALSVLGFLLLASFGTRGPLVCFIVFNAVYLLLIKRYNNPIKAKLLVLFISVNIIVFLTQIMLLLGELVGNMGMSDRIFQIALDGNFIGGEASGDERLYFIEVIKSKIINATNFWGFGLAGCDRIIGIYPHNIWIEILFSFGLIPGLLLIIILLHRIVKKFFILKNETTRCFLALLVCSSILKLCFSFTFLTDPYFFILIGFLFNNYSNDTTTE